MQTSVVRRYRFEAAHQLAWHPGKCARLHGHSYVLEVEVAGDVDERGVVVDFAEVDNVVRPLVDQLDHTFLNDQMPNPTAELVARSIANEIDRAGLRWSRIRLWETEDGWVLLER